MDSRDLQILQTVERNAVCTLFEYYKLGLLMGVPDEVLSHNERKTHRLEMLVLGRNLNSEIDVSDFFCDYLNRRVFVDVCQFYENKKAIIPLDRPLNMNDWEPTFWGGQKKNYIRVCFVQFRIHPLCCGPFESC